MAAQLPGRAAAGTSGPPADQDSSETVLEAEPSRLYTCLPAATQAQPVRPDTGQAAQANGDLHSRSQLSAVLPPGTPAFSGREHERTPSPRPVSAAVSPAEDEPAQQPGDPLPAGPDKQGTDAAVLPATRLRRDAAQALAVLLEDDACKLQVWLRSASAWLPIAAERSTWPEVQAAGQAHATAHAPQQAIIFS